MPSATYNLVRDALLNRQSITAMYDGYRRDLSPHLIGLNKNDEEQALFVQFGGGSKSGLPPGGSWRCMTLSKLSQVVVLTGAAWHDGVSAGIKPQSCVRTIDVGVG